VPVDDRNPLRKRRVRWHRWLAVFIWGPLVCVMLAIAGGASPQRWRPVAGFLAVAATAPITFWLDMRMQRRRMWRLRTSDVARGVRLTQPFWIRLSLVFPMAGVGALPAAVAAAVGFPGVAIGVFLTFAALAAWMPFVQFGMSPRALTFDAGGLRVHIRGGSFVVPWTTIAGVECIGPDHMQMVRLRLSDTTALVASAPSRPRVRAAVETLVREGGGPQGRLTFMPWTAGLDGPTLARTIRDGMAGDLGQVN
jgi:hypothetical protein